MDATVALSTALVHTGVEARPQLVHAHELTCPAISAALILMLLRGATSPRASLRRVAAYPHCIGPPRQPAIVTTVKWTPRDMEYRSDVGKHRRLF